ncbi:MAG: hypothetical protein HYV96_16255 [Opitutae bacterium]|nr:hypothetical protein [Opitutae bacterium]
MKSVTSRSLVWSRRAVACTLAGLAGLVSAFAFSSSDQAPWVPLGMGGNGYIDDLDLMAAPSGAKSRYFVTAGVDSGGVWVSFDEGQSFVPLGGPTWVGTAGTDKANGNVVKFVGADTSGRTVLVGADSRQIFRSRVDAATGELVLDDVSPTGGFSEEISVIQSAPSDAQVFYAGGGNRRVYYKGKIGISESLPAVWKSLDAGAHWNASDTLPAISIPAGEHGTVCNIAVHPTDASTLLAATDQGLYKFSGGAWSRLGNTGSNPLPHRAVFGVCYHPTNPAIIYCTTMPYDDMEMFLLLDAIPPGETSNRGGIFRSTDGGANWTKLDVGFTPPAGSFADTGFFYNVQVSASDPTRVYATYAARAAAERGVLRSTQSGDSGTWDLVSETDLAIAGSLDYQGGFHPAILSVFPGSSNDDVFVTGDVASNYKSTDSAQTFRSFTSSKTTVAGDDAFRGWGLEGGRGKYFSVAAGDPTKMFYADNDRGFWTSDDGGLDWSLRFNPDNATQGKGRFILPDPDNAAIVYAGSAFRTMDFGTPDPGARHFFKSTTGGKNPVPVTLGALRDNNVWDIALDPTVLASGDVATQRTLYLALGCKAHYHVDLVFNTATHTYDVYADGKQLTAGSPLGFETGSASSIKRVDGFIAAGTPTTFFLDNVGIYESYYDQVTPASLSTFETDTTGQGPSGWTVTGDAKVAEIPHASYKVMQLTATASAKAQAKRVLSTALSGAAVLVRFDVIFEDTAVSKRVVVYDAADQKVATIYFVNDGVTANGAIKAADGSGTRTFAAPSLEARTALRGVYKTTDGGTTWSDISGGLSGGPHLSHLRVDPNTPTTLYCGDERANGGVYRKVGAGQWTKIFPTAAPTTVKVGSLAAISRNGATHLYTGLNSGATPGIATSVGLWKSTDGGSTWTQQLDPATNTTLFPAGAPADLTFSHIEPGTSDEVLVASSYGVLRSTDAGASWSWFNDSIPNASTEFVRTATIGGVKRHYVGMRTEGFGVRYKMPMNVAFKRKSGSSWVHDWRHLPTLARVGAQAYVDAAYQIDALPSAGAIWLFTTSMDDRNDTSSQLLKLQPAASCKVYVAVPAGAVPGWLATQGFAKQTGTISVTERGGASTTLDVWMANVTSGSVTLGGLKNGSNTIAPVNYLVFLEPN